MTSQGYITWKAARLDYRLPGTVLLIPSQPQNAAKDFAHGLYSRFSPRREHECLLDAVEHGGRPLHAHVNQSNIAPGLMLRACPLNFGSRLASHRLSLIRLQRRSWRAKNSTIQRSLAADIDMTGMTPAQRQDLVTELTQAALAA